ncbi:MAG: hypothetical protein ACLFP4_04155 [Spirochaetales bacterium]
MKGLLIAALIAFAALLSAQPSESEPAFALLYTADTSGTLVIRSGRSVRIDDPQIPRVIVAGDQVTTDGSTTVELVTYPSLSRLTLGENSSVLIDRITTQETEVTLQFGRVRGDVSTDAAARLVVRGIAATVASEEGSFGLDQLVDIETGEIVARAYALDGSALVYPEDSASAATDEEAVGLASGEIVTRRGVNSVAQPGTIPQGLSSYWSIRPPSSTLVEPLDLLSTFAPLQAELEAVIGALPSYLLPPEPEPVVEMASEPEQEPEEAEGEEVASAAPEVETKPSEQAQETETPAETPIADPAAGFTDEELMRRRQSAALRASGAIAVAAGALADVSAIALNRYGADLFDTWSSNEAQTITTLSYTGGGLIATGLLLLSLSVIIGN